MTKDELLAKIQEICPSAILVQTEDGGEEICIATGLVEPAEGDELLAVEDYNQPPTTKEEKVTHYFSDDGNYGEADKLVVIETSSWDENDWDEIEETPDWDRPRVAKIINKKYGKN